MNVLVGVTLSGNSKNYVVDKFLEMADKCIRPTGAQIAWSTDREASWIPYGDIYLPMAHPGDNSEDVLMIAREDQRRYALDKGYDKLVWQGIDCLYQSSDHFNELSGYPVAGIGALTSARSKSTQAVAANFVKDMYGFTEEHTQFSHWALEHNWIIQADIPGCDALVLDKSALDLSWVGNHTPWYLRVAQGWPDLTCEGWYLLQLVKRGQKIFLHTGIKTWHVHEDEIARMYNGIEKSMWELSWD